MQPLNLKQHKFMHLSKRRGLCRHLWINNRRLMTGDEPHTHKCNKFKGHTGHHRCNCGSSRKIKI